MIEQDADRHLRRVRHVGEPAGHRLVQVDLAVLHQKVKARCNEGLGAKLAMRKVWSGCIGVFLNLSAKPLVKNSTGCPGSERASEAPTTPRAT